MSKIAKPIGPYSISREGNGLLFLSGQIPLDPQTGEIIKDFEKACFQCLENIENILKEEGLSKDSILKLTVLTTQIDQFDLINKVFVEFFGEVYPARSAFEVSKLPKNATIEIEAIAERKN